MSVIESKVMSIRKEHTKKLFLYEQRESCLFTEILIEIVRKMNTVSLNRSEDTIDKILDYIQENCAKNITNKEIGQKFGFHPNYISSLIKTATGFPLHRYIVHTRLSYAIDLLEAGELSIAQISRECGFCDVCYFTKCFKKYIGVLPSEYKWI